MTPREALDRIAALCDDTDEPMGYHLKVDEVRAVLAEVTPEPGGTTSDDHQRGYAQGYTEGRAAGWDERGALGGVLDRDQAREVLLDFWRDTHEDGGTVAPYLDRLAGCVRPVAGVWISPEQARRAAGWYFQQADDIVPDDADRALAAQLEAAS